MNVPIRIAIAAATVGIGYFPAKFAVSQFKKNDFGIPAGYQFQRTNAILSSTYFNGNFRLPADSQQGSLAEQMLHLQSGSSLSGTLSHGKLNWVDFLPPTTSGSESTSLAPLPVTPATSGTDQQANTPWDILPAMPSGYQLLNPSPTPADSATDPDSKLGGRPFSNTTKQGQ